MEFKDPGGTEEVPKKSEEESCLKKADASQMEPKAGISGVTKEILPVKKMVTTKSDVKSNIEVLNTETKVNITMEECKKNDTLRKKAIKRVKKSDGRVVKRKKTGVIKKVVQTPLRTRAMMSGRIMWLRRAGFGLLGRRNSPKERIDLKVALKRAKEGATDVVPPKRLKTDQEGSKTDQEDQSKSKTDTSEKKDAGEGTSGQGQGDFTKPKQVRKKCKDRRNSVRQNNKKGKFFKRASHGGGKNFKRRKKELGVIVPPTKFLLGGNINDPLNLNSLQDEEINRAMNAATPKSSPMPTPKHRVGEVEVILPRNIKDPLHLKTATNDDEYMKLLSKKNRKRRKRKRGYSGSGSGKEETLEEALTPVEEPISNIEGAFVPPDTTIPVPRDLPPPPAVKDVPKRNKLDKIVSPVVPQPGAWKRGQPRPPGANMRKRIPQNTPKFNPRNQRYQYGNYDRYYGYRNVNHEPDLRLQYFMQQPDLFVDKDVLDLGCNIGHVTLSIARDLAPKSIVGLDIDKKLIGIARKNVKHYVQVTETPKYSNCPSSRMPTPHTPHYMATDSPAPHRTPHYHQLVDSPAPHRTPHYHLLDSPAPHRTPHYSPAPYQTPHHTPQHYSPATQTNSPFHTGESPPMKSDIGASTSTAGPSKPFFPISMPILYGPLDPPGFTPNEDPLSPKPFPHNVSFVQGSYVLESDALLATETPQFDTILCLSVTKWIHLNWGDAGLKRAFRRMFAQLRPGGKLILEAQGWASYNKKKSLTEQIYRNYLSIELMPDKFIEYLLSPQVGFTSVEGIGAPQHKSKGFRRPINVLTKPGQTPSSCNTPVCYTPYSQRTCVRRPVYTSLGTEAFENEEDKKTKDS